MKSHGVLHLVTAPLLFFAGLELHLDAQDKDRQALQAEAELRKWIANQFVRHRHPGLCLAGAATFDVCDVSVTAPNPC